MSHESPVNLVIAIFVMPWEIDAYRLTIKNLTSAVALMDENDEVSLDIVLGISAGIVNWDKSTANSEDLVEAFHRVNAGIHWAKQVRLVVDHDGYTLGCCDHRRQNITRLNSGSTVVWLDPDIVFPPSSLVVLANGVRMTRNKLCVITPQLPRMWDDTWDCLVHERYTSEQVGFCYQFDHYQVYESAMPMSSSVNLKKIPEFKFAGGYLTALSADLLKLIGIPGTFRPYGHEDTFVMNVCDRMRQGGWPIQQYVIDGLLVAPDFSIQETGYRRDDLVLIQDKSENVIFNKSISAVEVDKAMQRIGASPIVHPTGC